MKNVKTKARVTVPVVEAAAAAEYLELDITSLEQELDGEGCAAARWGLEKTIGGLKFARSLFLAAAGKAS